MCQGKCANSRSDVVEANIFYSKNAEHRDDTTYDQPCFMRNLILRDRDEAPKDKRGEDYVAPGQSDSVLEKSVQS